MKLEGKKQVEITEKEQKFSSPTQHPHAERRLPVKLPLWGCSLPSASEVVDF